MLCPTAKNTVDLHQQQPVWIALIWGMGPAVKACFFLLLTSEASAAPVADFVNERISVSGAELEAHWRVDCAGVSRFLRRLAGRSRPAEDCRLSPVVRHQLQLCVFIYQAPGPPPTCSVSWGRHEAPAQKILCPALSKPGLKNPVALTPGLGIRWLIVSSPSMVGSWPGTPIRRAASDQHRSPNGKAPISLSFT